MAISADTLIDRLYLKNQITRWRLIAIGAIVLSLVIMFENEAGTSPIEPSFIARVTVSGVMTDDVKREKLIQDLAENSNAQAVIMRFNTPGGSAVAGQELYEDLRELSKKKPVVVVMRDLSASAGYLAALGADRIFASPGTLTGSIGVIIQATEFTELAKKLGVNPITIKTGKMKDALSPLSKEDPEKSAMMQTVVDDFYQVFVETIAERRKIPKDKVLKLADGRVYTGRQAVKHKLIDAIGSEEDAIAWLEKEKKITKDLSVKDISVRKDSLPFLEQISQTVFEKISPNAAARLDGLVAIWHPNLQIQ